ncbi:MAG: glycoside hydrolase family 43 protein [Spirochaetaceae bacterium]|jgi:GH43 family beta-xylosidase|nr:glycoside hydrolase family 43 protein [Spirochaetaceae bacterium]
MRISDIQIRDPFVVQEDGVYYLFGSTDKNIWKGAGAGFDVYVSAGGTVPESLARFEGPFPVFRPSANFWSVTNFWAPEVHRHNGFYFMFATFKPRQGRRGTAILKSSSGIMGPYEPWSQNAAGEPGPVTPAEWECLDGTFFTEQGKPYMVFCHEWQQVKDGEINLIPLTGDLRQASVFPDGTREPRLLFRASEAPWAHELQGRAPGSYVTDGPFMHRTQKGALLMLWSSFGKTGSYNIGTALSQDGTLRGPWTPSDKPLYSADGGHGMIFRGREGTLYLAIHRPNKTPFERPVFIPVTEEGKTLVLHEGNVIS